MTKRISYLTLAQILTLVFILPLLAISCDKSQEGCSPDSLPPARSAFIIQEGPTTQIAAEVGKDVGKVVASGEGSANRTIFIFEERHDSRLGQMEIALMLWRLQKNQGLRQVSLEGAFAAKGDLPVKWFHDPTVSGDAEQASEVAALRLLREGEINAAEFTALARPVVQVKGNEIESEYGVPAPQTSSALGYLIGIAERSLTSDDAGRVNDLVKAGKTEEALDTVFSKDAWAKERYQKLFGDDLASIEESICTLGELETKAKELEVKIDPQQETGFRDELNFYETASKRSRTIVNNTLAMIDPASTTPVALIVGAAHTSKVVELIKEAKLNYAVLSPLSLVTPTSASKLTAPLYGRKMDLKSIDGARMLGAFLDGRKKPPSVLWKQWLKSKAEIYASIGLIVAAASRNEPVPSEALKAQLELFESIRIDWSSTKITREGDQVRVMYKVIAQTNDTDPQQTVDIWLLGWHQPPPRPPGNLPPDPLPPDDFDMEKLLLAALEEDRNKMQVTDPDPAPKPGEVAIVQLSTTTRAAFSTDPTLLQHVISAR